MVHRTMSARPRPRIGAVVGAVGVALCLAAAGVTAARDGDAPRPHSHWVYPGPGGKLVYKRTERGDRIMDFSAAGYRGGGVAIPEVPVRRTVGPPDGDATAAIQEAIDQVSQLPLTDGFRGAVLLRPGTYRCERTLLIAAAGVVLRGSGAGPGGTTIRMTGLPHACIAIRGPGAPTSSGRPSRIADAYVPAGATAVTVADASAFRVGDALFVRRPVTDAWVSFMGMDTLVRDGRRQTWVRGETLAERTIRAIDGNRVTFDVPLPDSIDARYLDPPGAALVKCSHPGRIAQVGVEDLHILAPPQDVTITQPHHSALRVSNAIDGWVRHMAIDDTVNSLTLGGTARRITVEDVTIRHSVPTRGSAKPADFAANGSELLFHRCAAKGDNVFFFVTGAKATGPNVLLNGTFEGDQAVEPHQRWATGLLLDGCRVRGGGIDLMNRGEMGSGHGWTIGWAVAWNCVADRLLIQQPPGAVNWAIGCRGERKLRARPFAREPLLPEGVYDAHETLVAPASLYLAQLRERLGAAALKAIGY
jgi:hypothetical protein